MEAITRAEVEQVMLGLYVKAWAHNNCFYLHDGLQMQLYFGKVEACVQI